MENVLATLALSGASLVGKAAFSYAQAVAIKRISTFLQSTLEGSTSKPAPSSSSSSAESHSTSTAPSPSRTTTEQQNQQTMLMQQMNDRLETLRRLNGLLELKSTILKPAMDLCEWAASRGHSLLAGVMALSRDLQSSLDDLGRTVTALNLNVPDIPAIDAAITSFTAVLSQIDALVPFVQMALQIAGIQFGNRIDSSAISPVLLMRASNALSSVRASKSNTLGNPDSRFRVKMYTLFEGSARSKSAVDWTWKEEFAKAIAYMQFHKEQGLYTLCVDQDLNDERFHDDRDVLKIPIDPELGIRVGDRVRVQVRDISRLFYTNSGRLLNIEDARMPVLVLRVDERERDDSDPSVNAADPANPFSDAPKTPVNRSADPSKRVVRWIALELYDDSRSDSDDDDDDHDAGDDSASELQTTDAQTEPESLDSGPDADTESKTESNAETTTALESLTSKVGNLQLTPKRDPLRLKSDQSTPITPLQWYTPGYFQSPGPSPASTHHQQQRQVHPHPSSTLTTQQPLYTLCILEFMLRLASLEQLEGISHLHIPDEKVCFFLLNEAGTAGKAHSNLASSSASKLEYDGTGNIEHLATAQNQVISAVGGVGARIGALGAVNDRSMSVPIHGNTSSRAKGKLRHHHQ
eukprot:jgi/Hompol1/5428/HPOL_004505-RA